MPINQKLFGLYTSSLSNYTIQALKAIIFLRYDLNEVSELKLRSVAHPTVPGVGVILNSEGERVEDGLLVGTVRMGYGHHRMAYSLYTWAVAQKKKAYLHDILAFDTKESHAIKEIDGFYSQMSRSSSEFGGIIEWLWGQLMSQGNISSLQFSVELAERYKNLLSGLSPDLSYISTYPLNGQIAIEAGFKKVTHLVPDNFPQYYLLVPGAKNLVQSPASYMRFIEMGIPKSSLAVAGHWVSYNLSANAIAHAEARIARDDKKLKKRFLLAIGGAGAQKSYTLNLLSLMKDKLISEKFYLWINTGDHLALYGELKNKANELGIPYTTIEDWDTFLNFCKDNTLDKLEDLGSLPIVFFNFKNYYHAFSATDELIAISDALITKPSELAFFPIPKIFIRRVGDHEAASAFRSMELGEGTMECRDPEHSLEMIELFLEQGGIFTRMNECIIRNSREGVYDGAKNALLYT
jgi:hypothetical protein